MARSTRLSVVVSLLLLVGTVGAVVGSPVLAQPEPTESLVSNDRPELVTATLTAASPAGLSDTSATTDTDPTVLTTETATIDIVVNDSTNGRDTASTTVTVTEDSEDTTEMPTQLQERGVSTASYTAVLNGGSTLGAGNLATAIQSWAGDDGSQVGFVGDVDVGAGELSAMINYWATEIAG